MDAATRAAHLAEKRDALLADAPSPTESVVIELDDVGDDQIPVWDAAEERWVPEAKPNSELAQVVLAANGVINVAGGANRIDLPNMPVLNFVMPNRPVLVRFNLPTITSDTAGRLLTFTVARAADNLALKTFGFQTLLAAAGIPSFPALAEMPLRPGVALNGAVYNPGDAVALKLRGHHSGAAGPNSTIFAGVAGGGGDAFFEAVAR